MADSASPDSQGNSEPQNETASAAEMGVVRRARPENIERARRSQKPRGIISKILWTFCFVFFFCAFCALGTWQVERLGWKENLIKTANEHTHLPPVAAPPKADWGKVAANGEYYEYRPVTIRGRLLNDKEILVKASVLLNALDENGGAGYWVLTPLKTDDGAIVFINRGFVPMDKKNQSARRESLPQGEAEITGLLRLSENAGYLFSKNDPKNNVWYRRQLPAFADKLGLPRDNVAPYFIDADKTPNPGGWPLGGLTVVQFPNNHLSYAITWYCGALGTLIAAFIALRGRRKPDEGEKN